MDMGAQDDAQNDSIGSQDQTNNSAKYPIYFTQTESEPILAISDSISKKLESLFRGTNEAAVVGNLADNLSLPPKTASDSESSSGGDEETKLAEKEKKESKLLGLLMLC